MLGTIICQPAVRLAPVADQNILAVLEAAVEEVGLRALEASQTAGVEPRSLVLQQEVVGMRQEDSVAAAVAEHTWEAVEAATREEEVGVFRPAAAALSMAAEAVAPSSHLPPSFCRLQSPTMATAS